MSWRTLVVSSRCKLDLKLGYMVIRSEDTKRVLLDELSVIIVENSSVAITGCLLNELARRKIKLIFCDEKHNPFSELVPLYGSHDCSAKIKAQLEWDKEIKDEVWTLIVYEKIHKQAEHLAGLGYSESAEKLNGYLSEMEMCDKTNREGHAAKVYFNTLFGMSFSRSEAGAVNSALNYGYSLVLSAVNREVCACGYLTQLGLFHDNMFNEFNLSCDLMEPFRIVVDRYVKKMGFCVFESEQKHEMCRIFEQVLEIDGNKQYLCNAIRVYVHGVFDALNNHDTAMLKFYKFIEEEK